MDRERAAIDVLLAESAHFEEAFRWNEETGERRVSIILTLMTVAGGAAGIVTSSVEIDAGAKLRLLAWVALSLFILGLVTLLRLVRRNVATDEYRHALDSIRERLIRLTGGHLEDYSPFPSVEKKPRGPPLKRFLGLTLLMGTTNSVLLAAATMMGLGLTPSWTVGLSAFLLSLVLQTALVGWLQERLRKEVGLPSKQ